MAARGSNAALLALALLATACGDAPAIPKQTPLPPPPPATAHPPAADPNAPLASGTEPLTFAISELDLGLFASAPPGYDLDGSTAGTCRGEYKLKDGPGGVDNAFAGYPLETIGHLLVVADRSSLPDRAANADILLGRTTTLIQLENLGPEPSQNGLRARVVGAGPREMRPEWDGQDTWPTPAGAPVAEFDEGYVVSGTWVSGPETNNLLVLKLWAMNLVLWVRRPIIALKLSGTWPDVTVESGIIAGVLDRFQVGAEIQRIVDHCVDPKAADWLNWSVFSRDVMLDGSVGTADVECNGTSFGLAFRAERAVLGPDPPRARSSECP